jgi:hypothetical protein
MQSRGTPRVPGLYHRSAQRPNTPQGIVAGRGWGSGDATGEEPLRRHRIDATAPATPAAPQVDRSQQHGVRTPQADDTPSGTTTRPHARAKRPEPQRRTRRAEGTAAKRRAPDARGTRTSNDGDTRSRTGGGRSGSTVIGDRQRGRLGSRDRTATTGRDTRSGRNATRTSPG